MQSFLEIPARAPKPRQAGLTHIIDPGLGLNEIKGLLEIAGNYIDIAKLGWGTGYVTHNLKAKLDCYREYEVPVILGGTLGEVALARGKFDDFCSWIRELGLTHIEISDGVITLPRQAKLKLIERLAATDGLTVLSEVGSKDPDALVAPYRWTQEIKEELEAGARYVILEARETGNAGVFRPNGEVRMGLIEEIGVDIDYHRLIFEAPLKHQQVWFIERFGADVNLGNIQLNQVIGLETLRLGLRADTLKMVVPESYFESN